MLSMLLPAQIQEALSGRAVHERPGEQWAVRTLHSDVDFEEQEATFGQLPGMDRAGFVLNAEVNGFGDRRARLLSVES
jgi:hypothetical protein